MAARRIPVVVGFTALLLVVAVVVLACSDREPPPAGAPPAPGRTESPAATPSPTPVPLRVSIDAPSAADQGYAVVIRVFVRRLELPVGAEVMVSLGDGTEQVVLTGGGGFAEVEHVYLSAGSHAVSARATAPGFAPGSATSEVEVRPRQVVFIQGMNSSSRCPAGQGFLTRAPEWLNSYLFEAENLAGLVITESTLRYFSYSGHWCEGGVAADYGASDTCAGIDERLAPRLKEFIESLPEGKVTIVAHSMGGLVAAYLVGIDPAWARERIASVATFDSPLGGINFLRAGFLSADGMFDGDCGPSSDAVRDLRDDSDVTRTAETAGEIVPFYTSDATGEEGPMFARIEAVPGGRTGLEGERLHFSFGDDHGESWSQAGEQVAAKRAFVGCALMLAGATCLDGGP